MVRIMHYFSTNPHRMKRVLAFTTLALGILASSTQAITMIDLVASDMGTAEGALFQRTNFQATGTGLFNPFLDMKHKGSSGTEAAYNSGAWKLDGDNHRNQWNSNLTLASLVSVTIDKIDYYLFSLDANEKGKKNDDNLLSIDKLRIYQSDSADLDPGTSDAELQAGFGNAVWDLGDNWIKINSAIGSAGSGDADLNVFIPTSIFNGKAYVYLFNENGAQGGSYAAHAGFEEWSALTGPPINIVPDSGTTLALLGAAFLALIGLRSRKS